MTKIIEAQYIRFRGCRCGRPHCREYVMEFVNSKDRVFATYKTEGAEWQGVFKGWCEGIDADVRKELRLFLPAKPTAEPQ